MTSRHHASRSTKSAGSRLLGVMDVAREAGEWRTAATLGRSRLRRVLSCPVTDEQPIETDFRGSRRLVGREEWVWYLLAAISYIVLGIWHKWLLNWIMGPVWLVTIVVIGPWLTDRVGLTNRSRE